MNETYLGSLWSKAVLTQKGSCCYICGRPAGGVHHIIRRSHRVLRFDPVNGLPLCAFCHRKTHKIPGWEREFLSQKDRDHLDALATVNLKDYLKDNRLSRQEWHKQTAQKLRDIIKG